MKRDGAGERRAEQIFFDDPAVDGLLGVLMALATDHYALKDRVRVLEQHLVRSGHVDAVTLAGAPGPAERAANQADATAFAEDLLRPLLGLQDAVGTGGRFSLKASRRKVKS
jgi:hypothetical protein